jgi:hypothetical protein
MTTNITKNRVNTLSPLKRLEREKETISPIKNFLLKNSLLVQFQKKEGGGKSLISMES